jgi:DNA-binding response OmpR family regulator
MINAAWPNHVFVEPRCVDAHIVRLRKALNERGEAGLIRSACSGAYSRRSTDPRYELTQRRVQESSAS